MQFSDCVLAPGNKQQEDQSLIQGAQSREEGRLNLQGPHWLGESMAEVC